MKTCNMKVCESLEWTSVRIIRDNIIHELPLSADYRAGIYYQGGGETKASTTGRWRLPMKLDKCVLAAFAYQLDVDPFAAEDQRVLPVPREDVESTWFLTPIAEPDHTREVNSSEMSFSVEVGFHQVFLTLNFVFCRPKYDFEPGGVLKAAKMLCHAEIRCNFSLGILDSIQADLRIERPSSTTMFHGGTDMVHPMPGDTDGDMHADIRPLLVTDTNESKNKTKLDRFVDDIPGINWFADEQVPPTPFWDNLFDYYDDRLIERAQEENTRPVFTVADPQKTSRYLQSAVEFDSERSSTIWKFKGQGEFDNMHLAPRMQAPPYADKFLKHPDDRTAVGFDPISMAPFCIHDCLHTHWR